jgi:hypothetical protein
MKKGEEVESISKSMLQLSTQSNFEQQEVPLNARKFIIGSSRNNQWIRRWRN